MIYSIMNESLNVSSKMTDKGAGLLFSCKYSHGSLEGRPPFLNPDDDIEIITMKMMMMIVMMMMMMMMIMVVIIMMMILVVMVIMMIIMMVMMMMPSCYCTETYFKFPKSSKHYFF